MTSTTGALYRIDITNYTSALTATTTTLASSGWGKAHLVADGAGHLFATVGSNSLLNRYDIAGTKPTLAAITNPTRIGTGFALTSMTATGNGQLLGVTSTGKLMG